MSDFSFKILFSTKSQKKSQLNLIFIYNFAIRKTYEIWNYDNYDTSLE
jgi:hypothetical protein